MLKTKSIQTDSR